MCAATNPVAGRDGLAVLDAEEIRRALTRIAHEILERTHGGNEVILLGIPTRGVPLARRLAARIGEFEGLNVPCGSLDVTMHMVAAQLRAAQAAGGTPSHLDPDLEAVSLLAISAGLGTSVLGGQSSPGQAQAVIDYHLDRLFPHPGQRYAEPHESTARRAGE